MSDVNVGDLAKEFQTEGRQCHVLALELVRIGLACFYQGAMGAKRMSRSIKVPEGSTKPGRVQLTLHKFLTRHQKLLWY